MGSNGRLEDEVVKALVLLGGGWVFGGCNSFVVSFDVLVEEVQVGRRIQLDDHVSVGEEFFDANPEVAVVFSDIDCMDGKATSVCDYEDGKKALQLATGILQSGRYRERVIFDSF